MALTLVAWLFAAEPQPDAERVWHYWLFGLVLLSITGSLLGQVFDPGDASPYTGVVTGVALAFSAWFLGDTPYRLLTQITWGYAAACLAVPPAIGWVMARRRRGERAAAPQPGTAGGDTANPREPRDWGMMMIVPCLTIGLFLSCAVIVKQWGLWAGLAAFILWPATLIAVPPYAALAGGDWWPLIVTWGGMAAGVALRRLTDKRKETE